MGAPIVKCQVTEISPTIDFDNLDQVVEGYLLSGKSESEDRDQLIALHPNIADDLKGFLEDDDWMRRLAGSKRHSRVAEAADADARAREVPRTADGTNFGDYELLDEIGRGGMGVVYKARQRSLNRIVALKMIRSAQLASALEVQRFHAEAEAAAHLEHPGIVPVYASGEYGDQHYYSMGLVDGISLQELIAAESVLPATEAAELVRQVAEAIHYAHRRGVIHRDLKPANILLAESDREDALRLSGQRALRVEPKVVDFGLAKKTAAENELTGTGQILGTPSYMPPEQATGQSGPLSDIYSLGAVLYCLLIGRPPFQAANAIQTLKQVLDDEPVPPRQINSTVPRDLETICLRCLQKDPERRYGSAQDLATDLKRFRDGEPILARPVGTWERGYKWTRRHPATAALIVAGFFVLMAVVGLTVSWRYQGAQERLLYSQRVLRAHQAWRDNDISTAQKLLNDCPEHLCGWEWHYVERLCHTGILTTIQNPDWRVGPEPPKEYAYVFEVDNSRVTCVLEDPTNATLGVQFSEDGKGLWTECSDMKVRLWDLETKTVTRTMHSHSGLFRRIAYSLDGSRVATAVISQPTATSLFARRFGLDLETLEIVAKDANANVSVPGWDAALKDALSTAYQGHELYELAFSLDRERPRMVSTGSDGKIKLWDVLERSIILECEGHVGPVYSVCFSPDGKRLASAGQDLTIRIWDVLTGRLMLTLGGGQASTRTNRAASGGESAHSMMILGVAFDPDGARVASVAQDAVKVWNVGSGDETTILEKHNGPVRSVAFAPDGSLLASAADDGVVKFWRPASGTLIRDLPAHQARPESILALAISPNGQWLASAGHDRTVKVWNVKSGKSEPDHILNAHHGPVHGVAFSADGRHLASVGHDGKCVLWNVSTGQRDLEFEQTEGPHPVPVHSARFDPQGRFLALGGYKLTVRDLETGAESVLAGHEREILSVAVSPDGKRLASADRDGIIRVWDTFRGTQLANLKGHLAPATSVVFSPAGDRIASTSWDGSVKVWDPDSQQETLSLKGEGGRAYSVAFSPDGRFLTAANHDGTITIWGR